MGYRGNLILGRMLPLKFRDIAQDLQVNVIHRYLTKTTMMNSGKINEAPH